MLESLESTEKRIVASSPVRQPQLIAVASGKGGVGKTMVCLGLGWYLAKIGYRVVAVDMDFGVGNLHLSAGLGRVEKSLDDFFNGSTDDLSRLTIPIEDNSRFSIVSAAGRHSSATNVPEGRLQRLRKGLSDVDADFVLIDIGAGSSQISIECFVRAHRQIGVTTGDLSAMAALTALWRKARVHSVLSSVTSIFPWTAFLLEQEFAGLSEVFAVMGDRVQSNAVLAVAEQAAKSFRPAVMLNRARDADSGQIPRINASLARQFTRPVSISGIIPEDDVVSDCRRRGQNFLSVAPSCNAARALAKIAYEWHESNAPPGISHKMY